jgi:hypothetical protein
LESREARNMRGKGGREREGVEEIWEVAMSWLMLSTLLLMVIILTGIVVEDVRWSVRVSHGGLGCTSSSTIVSWANLLGMIWHVVSALLYVTLALICCLLIVRWGNLFFLGFHLVPPYSILIAGLPFRTLITTNI